MSCLHKLSFLLITALILTLVAESSNGATTATGQAQCLQAADTCVKCRELCDVVGSGAGYNCQTVSATDKAIKICKCNTTPPTILSLCKAGGAAGAAGPVLGQEILLSGICLATALMKYFL